MVLGPDDEDADDDDDEALPLFLDDELPARKFEVCLRRCECPGIFSLLKFNNAFEHFLTAIHGHLGSNSNK